MSGPTAVLDSDVLVPIVACHFLLTAFDYGLYEPIVSTTTQDIDVPPAINPRDRHVVG